MPIIRAGKMVSSQPDILPRIGEFNPLPAAGARSALKLDRANYLTIWLEFYKAGPALMTDAEIDAAVSSIDLLIDGKQKCGLSSTLLRVFNKFNTDLFSPMSANAGYFPLFLARHWMEDEESQDKPAWGTGNTRNIELAVTWTVGSVCTACNVYAEVGPERPLGRYISYEKFQVGVAAGGDLPIFDILLPTPDRSLYAMHIDQAVTVVDRFNVLPDGINAPPLMGVAGVPTALWHQMLRKYQLSPQAGYTHLCAVRRKRHADAIPLQDGLRIIPHFTAAPAGNSCILYCEMAQGDEAA
jgi:hypothetical protein